MQTRPLIIELHNELIGIPELTVELYSYQLFARFSPYPWIWQDTKNLILEWIRKVEHALDECEIHESELAQFASLLMRRIFIFKRNGERQLYLTSPDIYHIPRELLIHLFVQAECENDINTFKLLIEHRNLPTSGPNNLMYYFLTQHNIQFYDHYSKSKNHQLHPVFRAACVAYLTKSENDIREFQSQCSAHIEKIAQSNTYNMIKSSQLCATRSWLTLIGRGWLNQYFPDNPHLCVQEVTAANAVDILKMRYDSNSQKNYKHKLLDDRTNYHYEFKTAIFQATNLLENHDDCFDLLKKLNDELAARLSARHIKLDDFVLDQDSPVLLAGSYAWPAENLAPTQKLFGVLDEILLENEQTHGFNVARGTFNDDEKPIVYFNGQVPPSTGNTLVRKGILFKEVRNNALLHGDNTHRLQIYILTQAILNNKIQLPVGSSIFQFITSLARAPFDYDECWGALLDLPHTSSFADLSAPNAFHSLLLTLPDPRTKSLSAYLRAQFSKSMRQLCDRSDLPYVTTLTTLGCGDNISLIGVRNHLKIRPENTPLKAHYRSLSGISIFVKKKKPLAVAPESLPMRLLNMLD